MLQHLVSFLPYVPDSGYLRLPLEAVMFVIPLGHALVKTKGTFTYRLHFFPKLRRQIPYIGEYYFIVYDLEYSCRDK